MLKKVALLLATAVALAGCAATGEAGQQSPQASPAPQVTIGLTYIPNVQFSPFYLADSKGYYSERGVTAELRHHGANEGLFTALVAGQEDFVVAGGDELVQARAQGMDLVSVASYFNKYPVVLLTKSSSPIATTKDLKGKRIGLPGRYGESWFGLLVALKDAGLTEKDVTITEIGYTQQAALTTDKVDAVVGFSNNDAVQFAQAGVEVRQIPLSSGPVPLVGTSLITTGAFLKAQPELVKAVVGGTIAGVRQAVNEPGSALQETQAQVPGLSDAKALEAARATLLATAEVWKDASGGVSGTQDGERWSAMVAFMRSQGLIETDVDAAQCWTNDYLGN